MRGVAAIIVVAFHALLYYYLFHDNSMPKDFAASASTIGWIGVDFFFVLSAFLLSIPFIRKPQMALSGRAWLTYLGKRWLRIAPPYYAAILGVILLFDVRYPVTHWKDVLFHALYIQNADRDFLLSMNPAFWSLAVEFQFYLILPLLVLALSGRRMWWGLGAAVATTILYRLWTFDATDAYGTYWMAQQVPAYLAHFAFGIVAAQLWLRKERLAIPTRLGVLASIAGIIATPMLLSDSAERMLMPGYVPPWEIHLLVRPLLGLFLAAFVYFAVRDLNSVSARFLSSAPMAWLGKISYSLYLVHMPIMLFVLVKQPALLGLWFPALLCVLATVALLTATAFHYVVEVPSLRLKDVAFRTKRPTARVPTPTGTPGLEAKPRPSPVDG